MVKNQPANAGDSGDTDLIPGMGRSPGVEHGYPLQYSCLENSVDRGAWQATVHGVTKSWTLTLPLHFLGLSEFLTFFSKKKKKALLEN